MFRVAEVYPTKQRIASTNEMITTGYAVRFEGSDECIECHSGDDERNRINAYRSAAAESLYRALGIVPCPICEHPLRDHIDRYGCEHDRGDVQVQVQDVGAVAIGPCGCNGRRDDWKMLWVEQAIGALRLAKVPQRT